MTVGQKRPIRSRVWAAEDDKVGARNVGENMRDIAANLQSLPKLRLVTIENQFYVAGGIVFGSPSRPLGVTNIYSEAVDGTVLNSLLSGMTFDQGVCTVQLSGLSVGTRYSTIRLLVIG